MTEQQKVAEQQGRKASERLREDERQYRLRRQRRLTRYIAMKLAS